MKHRLLDLLACPVEKAWPLKLEVVEEIKISDLVKIPEASKKTQVVCNYYCNLKKFYLVELKENGSEIVKDLEDIKREVTIEDCKQCFQLEINKGKLICKDDPDKHIYEIKEGIPVMLSKEQIADLYGKKK